MGRGRGGAGRASTKSYMEVAGDETYRLFDGGQTAANWMNPEYENQTSVLDADEATAIHRYTQAGHVAINGILRDPNYKIPANLGTPALAKSYIKAMDKAFKRKSSVLKHDIVLGRKIDKGTAYVQNSLLGLKPGDVFGDAAFVSTSVNPTHTQIPSQLSANIRIYAARGTKAIWVRPISAHDVENEVILPRGTQFQVTSVSDAPEGYTINVRIIGQ